MAKVIARFEKVSFEQFKTDVIGLGLIAAGFVTEENLQEIYDNIKLPKRATKKSGGHDFWIPFGIQLEPGQEIIIPTGIKCYFYDDMDSLYTLDLYPRSGQGFNYKLRIKNTIGVIDEDYYGNPDNEGHIKVAIADEGNRRFELEAGKGFCQGIFHEVFVAEGNTEEDIDVEREGGTGSSDSQIQ